MVNFFGHLSFFIFTGQKCLPGWYVAKKCPMVPISKRGWVGVGKIYLIEQCQNRKKTLFIKVASFNNAVPCKPSSYQTQFVIVKVPKTMKNELMSSPLDHLKGRAKFSCNFKRIAKQPTTRNLHGVSSLGSWGIASLGEVGTCLIFPN